ncbi:MAG: response regulator [Nitrospinales bacterium]
MGKINRKIKALVVEDVSIAKHLVKRYLEKIGFETIFEADDGEQALQILRKEDIGLIISDWMMPKLDGLELLKRVRSDDELKNIPFIMATALGQKPQILEAIRAGAADYIVKPLSVPALEDKIKQVFENR